MKRIHIFSLLFFALPFAAKCQTYSLQWDVQYSGIGMSETMITGHKALSDFENKIFPLRLGEEEKIGQKLKGFGYRLSKYIAVSMPVDMMGRLIQHEVMGHGYRFRLEGYFNNSYNIEPPYPYGPWGGFANPGRLKSPRKSSLHELMISRSDGLVANQFIANDLRWKWMESGTIPYRESNLFMAAYHDLIMYILIDRYDNPYKTDDILNYLSLLHEVQGINDTDEYMLTLPALKRRTLLGLINPFNWMAARTMFKDHFWDGKAEGKLKMLQLGKYQYMPSLRVGLTPFGDEVYCEFFVKDENRLYTAHYRHGASDIYHFWGASIEGKNTINISERVILGGKFDIWRQPSLMIGGESISTTQGGMGAGLKANIMIKLWDNPTPVFLHSWVGYKTNGYLEGERLDDGWFARYGLAFKLE